MKTDYKHNIGQAREVAWYEKHGKYPGQRIVLSGSGEKYVIGDLSWNQRGRPYECIEPEMVYAVWKPLHNACIKPNADGVSA